jgi:hypothetical protein
MDLVYIGLALALWLAIWGLAHACERLRPSGKECS